MHAGKIGLDRLAEANADSLKPPEKYNPWGNWYAGIRGGALIMPDTQFVGSGLDMDTDFNAGFALGADIGYAYDFGMRLEFDFTYRSSQAEQLDITTDPGIGAALGIGALDGISLPASGNIESVSFMLNAWYDIKFLNSKSIPWISNWVPYFGGGAGLTHAWIDVGWNDIPFIDASDTTLAWQGGGGLAYKISDELFLAADYRFFRTFGSLEFDDPLFASPIKAKYKVHNIMLGLRGFF